MQTRAVDGYQIQELAVIDKNLIKEEHPQIGNQELELLTEEQVLHLVMTVQGEQQIEDLIVNQDYLELQQAPPEKNL